MMNRWYIVVFLFNLIALILPSWLRAQTEYPWLRSADELYQQENFQEAELAYRRANELKQKPSTSYNLGNSIYLQNRMPEAIAEFKKATEGEGNNQLRSKAYYNLGNAYFQNQQWNESIQSYKASLKLNPKDEEAKKNLMLALRQLQKQQQEQNQQQQEQQEQQQEEQQQQEQNQQQQQQQQQLQEQQQPQPQEEMNKEEAKDILKAIEREDQRVQEKMKKAGTKAQPAKDW